MANIKEVTVSLGRTIQVKEYEPLNYHVSYKFELVEGEDLRKETIKVRRMLQKEITAYCNLITSKGEKVQTVEREMYCCQSSGCGQYVWDDDDITKSIKRFGKVYCKDCYEEQLSFNN